MKKSSTCLIIVLQRLLVILVVIICFSCEKSKKRDCPNPYASVWGNMHWGHAVSKDLTRWEHQPVAIVPDTVGTIFSGCAVIDKNNTAGFGKNAMIAIYISAGKMQTQSIAYSLDNGKTFIKYEGNPVLSDTNIVDFRDPKVFWHDASQKWIMSLATSQTITFYSSSDMKEWEKLSEFGENIGAHGGVWECPDLFPLPITVRQNELYSLV